MSVCEAERKSLFWTSNLVPGSEHGVLIVQRIPGSVNRKRAENGCFKIFKLITAEQKSNSAFEAIQTQIKITGLPPEKRGQVIKSFWSEQNVFAVTEENKDMIQ